MLLKTDFNGPLQFYIETVKQMALHQLVAGSPLRTLCLLIAGQPADVFSADSTAGSSMAGAVNMPQQPAQVCLNDAVEYMFPLLLYP